MLPVITSDVMDASKVSGGLSVRRCQECGVPNGSSGREAVSYGRLSACPFASPDHRPPSCFRLRRQERETRSRTTPSASLR